MCFLPSNIHLNLSIPILNIYNMELIIIKLQIFLYLLWRKQKKYSLFFVPKFVEKVNYFFDKNFSNLFLSVAFAHHHNTFDRLPFQLLPTKKTSSHTQNQAKRNVVEKPWKTRSLIQLIFLFFRQLFNQHTLISYFP